MNKCLCGCGQNCKNKYVLGHNSYEGLKGKKSPNWKGGFNRKKWVEENREDINRKSAIYRKNNKDRIIVNRKRYQENNVDKIKDYHKEYRKKNKDRIYAKQKQKEGFLEQSSKRVKRWREENRDHHRAYSIKYRKENIKERTKYEKDYRIKNRITIRQKAKDYYKENDTYRKRMNACGSARYYLKISLNKLGNKKEDIIKYFMSIGLIKEIINEKNRNCSK